MKCKRIRTIFRALKQKPPQETVSLADGFERCVLCGEPTDVPVTMPIELRENYEIGCGQLCFACYHKLYEDTREENIFSHK